MLARGKPSAYSKTVATTWTLAFNQLEPDRMATGLLRLLACCAPMPVRLSLLHQPPDSLGEPGTEVLDVLRPLLSDPLVAGDAIAALRRYSLITPTGHGQVLTHRLVQAVTLDQMPAELATTWRHAAAMLIEAAIPMDTDSPDNWPACAALLPHAQATLTYDSDGLARIANYLGESGSDVCRAGPMAEDRGRT